MNGLEDWYGGGKKQEHRLKQSADITKEVKVSDLIRSQKIQQTKKKTMQREESSGEKRRAGEDQVRCDGEQREAEERCRLRGESSVCVRGMMKGPAGRALQFTSWPLEETK